MRVGEVFRDAVRRQAAALVVVHNHPSGDPTPSADDLRITAELAQAGRLLDIELLDHIVIGVGGMGQPAVARRDLRRPSAVDQDPIDAAAAEVGQVELAGFIGSEALTADVAGEHLPWA